MDLTIYIPMTGMKIKTILGPEMAVSEASAIWAENVEIFRPIVGIYIADRYMNVEIGNEAA